MSTPHSLYIVGLTDPIVAYTLDFEAATAPEQLISTIYPDDGWTDPTAWWGANNYRVNTGSWSSSFYCGARGTKYYSKKMPTPLPNWKFNLNWHTYFCAPTSGYRHNFYVRLTDSGAEDTTYIGIRAHYDYYRGSGAGTYFGRCVAYDGGVLKAWTNIPTIPMCGWKEFDIEFNNLTNGVTFSFEGSEVISKVLTTYDSYNFDTITVIWQLVTVGSFLADYWRYYFFMDDFVLTYYPAAPCTNAELYLEESNVGGGFLIIPEKNIDFADYYDKQETVFYVLDSASNVIFTGMLDHPILQKDSVKFEVKEITQQLDERVCRRDYHLASGTAAEVDQV